MRVFGGLGESWRSWGSLLGGSTAGSECAGLADQVAIMVIAVVTAVLVMLVSAKPIGDFVERHPTLKMLALSFLLLIGTTLVADGLGFHFPKGYVYFAMAFSVFVEMLNMRLRKVSAPEVAGG